MTFLTNPLLKLGALLGGALIVPSLVSLPVKAETFHSLHDAAKSSQAGPEYVAQLPAYEERPGVEAAGEVDSRTISLTVYNNTGADVTYRVVGNTGFRVLPAGESASLVGLPIPINFFFDRNDEGLSTAYVEPMAEENTLEVTLEATLDPSDGVQSILVNESGEIFKI